jgi:DNA-binding NarL/FixJ family response regulator
MVAPEPAARAPIRVMLADESDAGRMLLAAMLRDDTRFEVVAAVSTGAQLVAASDHADLVIVDLVLADTDAFTAIDQLHERDPELPVVVFASVDPPYLRAEAQAHGAVAFFRRGADPQAALDGFVNVARLTKAD